MSKRVLIIEDDPDIARLVALHIRDLGCDVVVVSNGAEGLQQATATPYDLVVLDIMLPEMDGFEVCQQLRRVDGYTPILILTARSADLDRVLGLELGADDYLTKPFNIAELQARVKALFRRIDHIKATTAPRPTRIEAGALILDRATATVMLEGRTVDLTATEFELLAQLAQHPGRVYARSELLDLVWGYGQQHYGHTVNSHINRLRVKLERNPAQPQYIVTVWGKGYRFCVPDPPSSP
jgi:DNA-binding response OmpR family regulator